MKAKEQLQRKQSVHMVGWPPRRSGNHIYILAGAYEINSLHSHTWAYVAEETYKNRNK